MIDTTQKPFLSHSQLDMFTRCPEQYRRRYIEREKIPPGIAMLKGTGFHGAAKRNFRQKMQSHEDMPPNEIVDAAVAEFEGSARGGYMLTEEERSTGADKVVGQAKDQLVQLAYFYAAWQAPDYQPVLVEERVRIELAKNPYDLLGILDLADTRDIVADFKTTGRSKQASEADTSTQLTIYAAAFTALTHRRPQRVALDVIVQGKKGCSRQLLESDRAPADFSALANRLPIAVPTINKEVRALRAIMRKAQKWEYTQKVPDFDFLRELEKLPEYVPPEHFASLYGACDKARLPRGLPYPPADWWRALIVTIYLTGWRIEQTLALRRADIDLETGDVFSAAATNKGRRDVRLVLHLSVVEHLRRLPGFSERILPWPHRRATLWEEFGRIQVASGVAPDRKRRYGFHDLRRAFATLNADRITADALQRLMQHADYQTTQRYINMARQLRPAAENLYVPEILKRAGAS
jgi:integrase